MDYQKKTWEMDHQKDASLDMIGRTILGNDDQGNPRYRSSEFCDIFGTDLFTVSLSELLHSPTFDQLLDKLCSNESAEINLERVRAFEYSLAYRYIQEDNVACNFRSLPLAQRHQRATTQNHVLRLLHTQMDTLLEKDFQRKERTDLLARIHCNQEHQKSLIGNVKVFRGLNCNAKCVFCFQEPKEGEKFEINPQVAAFVEEHRRLTYTPDELFRAIMYARCAYGIREVSVSGGEALVNIPGEGAVNVAKDVAVVAETGIPQITMMSNGRLATPEKLQNLYEAGLTHLIISIHTVDSQTHFRIMNWKDKGRFFSSVRTSMVSEGYPADEVETALSNIRFEFDAEYDERTQDVPNKVQEEARRRLQEKVATIHSSILANVQEISQQLPHLTVRFNVAYDPQAIGTDLKGLVDFAKNHGAKELTLIEMIPGNETSIQRHAMVPDDRAFEEIGFQAPMRTDSRNWNIGGIRIYRAEDFSVAVCTFGQLAGLDYTGTLDPEERANFSGQTKELIMQSTPQGGVLGTEAYSVETDTLELY